MKIVSTGQIFSRFLAGYEGYSLVHFFHCFHLQSFSYFLPELKPGQNPGCLASGPNEAQVLMSHCKNLSERHSNR